MSSHVCARRGTTLVIGMVTVFLIVAALHLFGPQTGFRLLPITPFEQVHITGPPPVNDADNRQLDSAQCMERYPLLYAEADRARDYYTNGISLEMVDTAEKDGASARVAIINNKAVYWGINSRTQAVLAAIYRAVLTSPEPLSDAEFVIQTTDAGEGSSVHFALDRTAEQPNLWLMPDFGFYSWPEPGVGAYTEVREKTETYERELGLVMAGNMTVQSSWSAKISKLMWRGAPMVKIREDLLRASKDQSWSDVKSLDWAKLRGEEKDAANLKTPAEHCQYKFLAHVEGYAYSGRLKYLQQCRSVVIAHPLKYIQHYHHLFDTDDSSPTQNMIEVPLPLEDNLAGVMEQVTDPANAASVERIAENSWNLLRQGYISPAANECYWRYILKAYASVQTFEPTIGDGVPYESYLLMGTTHWDPHR